PGVTASQVEVFVGSCQRDVPSLGRACFANLEQIIKRSAGLCMSEGSLGSSHFTVPPMMSVIPPKVFPGHRFAKRKVVGSLIASAVPTAHEVMSESSVVS